METSDRTASHPGANPTQEGSQLGETATPNAQVASGELGNGGEG